jgi:hypothetical protein
LIFRLKPEATQSIYSRSARRGGSAGYLNQTESVSSEVR